jgi:hypothetical protein
MDAPKRVEGTCDGYSLVQVIDSTHMSFMEPPEPNPPRRTYLLFLKS